MDALEKKVMAKIDEKKLIKEGDHLLVACSGGVDSMVLLHVLHKYKDKLRCQISCVHVDHMLRGAESYEDLLFVQQFCRKNGILFFGTSIPIKEIVKQQGGNKQKVCRDERYSYFRKVMEQTQANVLVTAHHADDHVETMLMSLVKNRSANGLTGIAWKRNFAKGQIIRPLLSVKKEQIKKYAIDHQISWREDVSNATDDYTRNRFRHHIIPQLEKENTHLSDNLLVLSEHLREDQELLMEMAYNRFAKIVNKLGENFYKISIQELKAEPVALQRRLILILLNYVYRNDFSHQTAQLIQSILSITERIEGHAEVHLPNGWLAKRSYDELTIIYQKPQLVLREKELLWNEWTSFGYYRIFIGNSLIEKQLNDICSSKNVVQSYYFNASEIENLPTVRPHQQGDRIHIVGMEHEKKVSRIFIDEKIPSHLREYYPLILCGQTIIAVGALRHHAILSKVQRTQDDSMLILAKNDE